jgi:hypothetical protein
MGVRGRRPKEESTNDVHVTAIGMTWLGFPAARCDGWSRGGHAMIWGTGGALTNGAG